MTCSVSTTGALAALGLAMALGLSTPATADIIRVSYAGTLTEVSGDKLGDFFGIDALVIERIPGGTVPGPAALALMATALPTLRRWRDGRWGGRG